MRRKLVKLDTDTGNYAEVDKTRLKREARNLLDFIHKNIDPNTDEHKILNLVAPLCQGILDETLKVPVPYSDLPLKYEVREGLLPENFYRLYAEFKLTISGIAREILESVEIGGVAYTYADFEEQIN